MDKFHQELFDVLTRARPRPANRQSKAASLQLQEQPEKGKGKEMITICKKEYQDLLDNKCANVIKQVVRKSMAASYQANGINPAQLIHNFITK